MSSKKELSNLHSSFLNFVANEINNSNLIEKWINNMDTKTKTEDLEQAFRLLYKNCFPTEEVGYNVLIGFDKNDDYEKIAFIDIKKKFPHLNYYEKNKLEEYDYLFFFVLESTMRIFIKNKTLLQKLKKKCKKVILLVVRPIRIVSDYNIQKYKLEQIGLTDEDFGFRLAFAFKKFQNVESNNKALKKLIKILPKEKKMELSLDDMIQNVIDKY